MISFKGKHFPKEIILFAVHFYLRYSVSYQDLEEDMQERVLFGVVSWVENYANCVPQNENSWLFLPRLN